MVTYLPAKVGNRKARRTRSRNDLNAIRGSSGMERVSNVEEAIESRAKQIATVVLAFVFTTIESIAPDLTVIPGIEISGQNLGIFIPASGAIIFGKGVGAGAAGLGSLANEFKNVLTGEPINGLYSIGVLLNAASLSIGTLTAGLLGTPEGEDFLPKNLKQTFFGLQEWASVGRKTLGSVIGVGMTGNFLYAYGSQIQEGASIAGGTVFFLQLFIRDTIVLVTTLPVMFISYDIFQMLKQRKAEILETLLKQVNWKITDSEPGLEVLSVKLPESSMIQGKWVPVLLVFRSLRDEPTAYNIEGVATTKITPMKDKTPPLKKGEKWIQSFFVLPSKQKVVNARFRILPVMKPKFRHIEAEDTIVELEAKTRDPQGFMNTLLGFSGLNFGVAGAGVVWDKVIELVNNPDQIINSITGGAQLVFSTIMIEVGLFIPVVLLMYRNATKVTDEHKMKLSFSNDIEDQKIQELPEKLMNRLIERYAGKAKFVIYTAMALGTLGGIGYLGFQGFKVFTEPGYAIANADLIAPGIAIIIGSWIVGIKGDDALRKLNLLKEEVTPGTNHFVVDFKPLAKFQQNVPNPIILTVYNPSSTPGIRVTFEGQDNISPPMLELHIKPREKAQAKIVVTPTGKDGRKILALASPLFDENEEYLDAQETEPYGKQELEFIVQGESSLGVTKDQENTIKKLGAGGVLIGSAITIVNQFLNLGDLSTILTEQGPLLAGAQTPFVYTYFKLQNKFEKIKQDRRLRS